RVGRPILRFVLARRRTRFGAGIGYHRAARSAAFRSDALFARSDPDLEQPSRQRRCAGRDQQQLTRSLRMASPIPFDKDFDVEPGRVYELSPLLRRITCPNAGMFTFKGTNTYIVGRGRVAVVDPGPDLPEQTEAILRALDGETVTHIVVTHTHNDHSPGVPALVAATGAKTYAFGPH